MFYFQYFVKTSVGKLTKHWEGHNIKSQNSCNNLCSRPVFIGNNTSVTKEKSNNRQGCETLICNGLLSCQLHIITTTDMTFYFERAHLAFMKPFISFEHKTNLNQSLKSKTKARKIFLIVDMYSFLNLPGTSLTGIELLERSSRHNHVSVTLNWY